MNTIASLLLKQTIETQHWVDKITNDLSVPHWFDIPENINSSIAWQIGHITVSQFYYNVVLVKGFDSGFAENIDLKKYSHLFGTGRNMRDVAQQTTREELIEKWRMQQELSIAILGELADHQLNEPTVPHRPHPFVALKQEAIEWNNRHNMWHAGQIGTIRRLIGVPYNFGF